MPHYPDEIEYSEKYMDDTYEYRHVILPKHVAKKMYANFGYGNKQTRTLLTEDQWRGLGVQQSRGWCHYETHRPEPHILLFRRPLGTNPLTGMVESNPNRQSRERFPLVFEAVELDKLEPYLVPGVWFCFCVACSKRRARLTR